MRHWSGTTLALRLEGALLKRVQDEDKGTRYSPVFKFRARVLLAKRGWYWFKVRKGYNL